WGAQLSQRSLPDMNAMTFAFPPPAYVTHDNEESTATRATALLKRRRPTHALFFITPETRNQMITVHYTYEIVNQNGNKYLGYMTRRANATAPA
ncbi:MAG TPA: hypothetical protein VGM32_18275, partial [Rhodopila sp.]